jgi:hypothetical protein
MKVPRGILADLVDAKVGCDIGGYVKVADEHIDNLRWNEARLLVFSFAGSLWRATYRTGLTENQDYGPFEFEGDEIECRRSKAVQVTAVRYEDWEEGSDG